MPTSGVKSQAKSNVTRVLINIGAGDGAQDDSRRARQRVCPQIQAARMHPTDFSEKKKEYIHIHIYICSVYIYTHTWISTTWASFHMVVTDLRNQDPLGRILRSYAGLASNMVEEMVGAQVITN